MRFSYNLGLSISLAVAVLFLAMFADFVPCKIAPVIPNPIYQWSTCSLNPDSLTLLGINRVYYGYTESLRDAYVITLVSISLVTFGLLSFFKSKSK